MERSVYRYPLYRRRYLAIRIYTVDIDRVLGSLPRFIDIQVASYP